VATTLIGGNETGLLDSTRLLLNRNDQAREGVLGHGEQSFINVANGNLVLQQRDVYMPSLGEDFGLVRTYNSRGVPSDAHQHEDARWTFSTFVRLNERHDTGTTYFEVEYGDGSTFEYRLNPNTGLYESVDGAGAFETLRDLGVNRPGIAAYELTRADQTKLSFDKQGHLLSSVDTNGVRMDYFYASDRLQQVRDDTGHTINYEYENGVLHRLTNETGLVLVEYRYTSGRLSEVIDRDGHSTKYFYTNDGFLNRIELPSAQDANGDGVPETFATRALLIDYEQVNWRGDQQGKAMVVTRVTDAEGGVTTFDYSFEFTTPGASQAGKGQFKRVDTTTTTYYAVNAAALTITQTGTRTVSVPAFYTVQAGDTWQSIATSLYGTPNAAAALQAALNNPALSAGAQLTGLPPSLSFTQTTTVSVPPYYTVQAGDTWASIAQAVYGTSDAEVIAALQSALGNPALVAGTQLIVPLELTYTPGSVTKNANPAALSNTITSTNTYNLNSGQLTTPTTSGWNVNATLVASSSTNATAPQIRYDQNGNGIAVWVLGNDLFWSRYTKSSDSWTAAAALDGTLTNAPSQPHLSISANGNALVTWVQNGNIYARRFIAGVWDGATTIPNLENLTGAARNPVGAINDAGRAVVSFVQVNGTVSNVYTNVFNGSAWQSAATAVDDIGTANANTIGATVVPSVAIDPSNNATVLWLQKTGTQTADSLYFSRFNP
jgi:LysM repeat protein